MVTTVCESFLREKNCKLTWPPIVKAALARRKLRTITVVELKEDVQASHCGIFQCASYAISESMTDMKLYKDKPIYLLLSSNGYWYFCTLTMRSIVEVGDDGLVKNDPCEDKDALDARLHERLVKLKPFSFDREMSNEPGRYPVGEMCIRSEMFERSLSFGTVKPDDFFFVQCLLRLMLGDTILKINIEDAREIIKICKEEENEISERIEKISVAKKLDAEIWRSMERGI